MTVSTRASRLLTSLAVAALAACTAPDLSPTALAPSEQFDAAARPSASQYSYVQLPTLSGFPHMFGFDVNDQGVVAGTADSDTDSRGFLFLGGQLVTLTQSESSRATGVSNGDPMYVVGRVSVNGVSRAARWTVTGGTIGTPAISPVSGGSWKVNDLGEGVGGEYIWHLDNSVEQVALPGDLTILSGAAIDDAGLTLFNAKSSPTSPDRGFLRLTDGTMVPLDPPAGRESYATSAGGLTEPDGNGIVQIAGTIALGSTRYPVRWTANVATRQATVLADTRTGFATDVSSAGTRVGASGGLETDAYAWRLDGTKFKLPAPRGAQDAAAYAISDDGRFATGVYYTRQGRRALLWSGTGP